MALLTQAHKRIEFIEEIEFAFKNANGDTLEFKGFLNGLRNEVIKDSIRYYTADFTSEAVRKNEQTRVVKAFKKKYFAWGKPL